MLLYTLPPEQNSSSQHDTRFVSVCILPFRIILHVHLMMDFIIHCFRVKKFADHGEKFAAHDNPNGVPLLLQIFIAALRPMLLILTRVQCYLYLRVILLNMIWKIVVPLLKV